MMRPRVAGLDSRGSNGCWLGDRSVTSQPSSPRSRAAWASASRVSSSSPSNSARSVNSWAASSSAFVARWENSVSAAARRWLRSFSVS
jgi:hypothetical protein